MTPRDVQAVWMLAPKARPEYRAAFDLADTVLPRFGIETPLRMMHFLAQCLHETAGLTVLEENLNYTVERLTQVWPLRFPTMESARFYARNPRALANKVYGLRLGNTDEEDGWFFRGRGLLQITGRGNYEHVGHVLDIDLAHEPELVLSPAHGLAVAACIWHLRGANPAADRDDVLGVTKAINGGTMGADMRLAWLRRVKQTLGEVS